MKLIEADKVEQAIKDYWKAQVDKLPIPKSIEEHDERVNRLDAILEHNDGLLKAIDELPSAEHEAISRWKNEFKEYVDSLDIARDDWKGIIEYIDELPSAEPDTTTDGSNVVKKGGNGEDRTSGDCISRQQAIDKFKPWLEAKSYGWGELNMIRAVINELENMPSAQPFRIITLDDVLKYIDDMPEDVWQEFTACLECRGWELQRRTAKWCGGDFA